MVQGFRVNAWRAVSSLPQIALCALEMQSDPSPFINWGCPLSENFQLLNAAHANKMAVMEIGNIMSLNFRIILADTIVRKPPSASPWRPPPQYPWDCPAQGAGGQNILALLVAQQVNIHSNNQLYPFQQGHNWRNLIFIKGQVTPPHLIP